MTEDEAYAEVVKASRERERERDRKELRGFISVILFIVAAIATPIIISILLED